MTVKPIDVIDILAGLDGGGGELSAVRDRRAQAREHAQRSFQALLEPEQSTGFSTAERYAVAFFTSALHDFGAAARFYADLLADEAPELVEAVTAAAVAGRVEGPYGAYREAALTGESSPGMRYRIPAHLEEPLGARLAAALEHTHLLVFRPREAAADDLRVLVGAGWDADEIVSLSQLVAFLAFQLRSAWSLRVIAGDAPRPWDGAASDAAVTAPRSAPAAAVTDLVEGPESLLRPDRFTQDALGWVPWLRPVAEADLTEVQLDALVERSRAAMPYFRLLARDPAALRARTLTDFDIFTSTQDGLPRAERELAATAASRLNGCVFCASVHASFATRESGRRGDVQRLLDEGVGVTLGDERWDAVIAASAALSATPPAFSAAHVQRLRAAGLDEAAIVDAANGAAFFNWANRLMLSLGEPEVPRRRVKA